MSVCVQDLYHDATRDLRALGCHISIINNCQMLDRETRVSGLAKDMQEGVLFMCVAPVPPLLTCDIRPSANGLAPHVVPHVNRPPFLQEHDWLHACLHAFHRHVQMCAWQEWSGFRRLMVELWKCGCQPDMLLPFISCPGVCRTYTTLIQQGKGRTRLQQVMDWCGGPDWDGPLIFDEASPLPSCLRRRLISYMWLSLQSVHVCWNQLKEKLTAWRLPSFVRALLNGTQGSM